MSSSACTRPVLLVIAALLVYSGSTYASRLLEASLVQSEPHDLLHAGPAVVPIPRGSSRRSEHAAASAGAGDVRELELCDCERALGTPHGLTCEKQGWFVTGFENEGSWLAGGGLVPLSHAVCCRPCLPDTLPEDPTGTIQANDSAVAVISIGCHASTAIGPSVLQCEPTGGSLSVGWRESIRVSPALDAYYPVGAAECCTPALLLESGDAWELERCNCVASEDVDCGGADSGRLLQGFVRWRMTFETEFVPIAPALCCKACLSERVHPVNSCADRAMCSGHGVCILGQCECTGGYRGGDCSVGPFADSDSLPQWAIALIVMGSCITLAIVMVLIAKAMHYYNLVMSPEEEEESEGSELEEPLLLRLGEDDHGSVGSEDTTECGSDTEEAIADAAATLGAASHLGRQPSEERATTDGTVPTRATLRIIPTPERRLLLRESLAAAVAAAAAAAERRGHGGASPAPAGDASSAPGQDAASAGVGGAAGPAGGGIFVDSVQDVFSGQRHEQDELSATLLDARTLAAQGGVDGQQPDVRPDTRPEAPAEPLTDARPEAPAEPVAAEAPAAVPGQEAVEQTPPQQQQQQPQLSTRSNLTEGTERDGTHDESGDDDAKTAAQQLGMESGPLAAVDCSVCMCRPVQVVVIPCGHACMCRRCSRRLARCPVCRKDIFRRQKLYVGG